MQLKQFTALYVIVSVCEREKERTKKKKREILRKSKVTHVSTMDATSSGSSTACSFNASSTSSNLNHSIKKRKKLIRRNIFCFYYYYYFLKKTSFRDIYLTPLQNTTTWESIKILPASFTGAKWEFH